jgi:hemerythrin-like domain-containing protein
MNVARWHSEHADFRRCDGAVVARGEIEAAASTYLVYYHSHIAREEDGVLDRAAALLTPEDWESVRTAVPAAPDPLTGADAQERYRELRRHIALESSALPDR